MLIHWSDSWIESGGISLFEKLASDSLRDKNTTLEKSFFFLLVEFNIDTGKVKLHINYPPELSKSKWGNKNTEVIETPIEELSDWVNSLTLDRQSESFRRIFKKMLSERKRSL